MKEKKFTFDVARSGGGPRSYTKKESELKPNEINLLLGNLINEFNKMPESVKMMFMMRLTQTIKDQHREELENDLQGKESEHNNVSEQPATISDENQNS